jgi:hypothetical protein
MLYRTAANGTLLRDGRVLILHYNLHPAEIYDPASGMFNAANLPGTPYGDWGVALPDGRVLIMYADDANSVDNKAEIFDPATNTVTASGSVGGRHDFGTVAVLADGRVLFLGGIDGGHSVAAADIFDPATGKFGPTGAMTTAREGQTATLLADGRVLVTGGEEFSPNSSSRYLSSSEIYDPKTARFTPTGSLMEPRTDAVDVMLPDGCVMIMGGAISNHGRLIASNTAELFDPATGKFTRTGSMSSSRSDFSATLLKNGRVLVAGGMDADGHLLASAELFDEATGQFTPTGSLAEPQLGGISTTLLPDGRVLLLGQDLSDRWAPSPELYWP